jgi:hypothetical protein
MTALREAVQEYLVADNDCGGCGHFKYYAERFRAALAQQEQDTAVHMTHCNQGEWEGVCKYGEEGCPALAQQEPVAWTDRELQLIDGMIEVQLRHAAQCDGIANRPMAERQKGWDMERVALLQKIKSNPPRREWRGLTMQEINALPEIGGVMWRMGTAPAVLRAIRAVERALKEKNS